MGAGGEVVDDVGSGIADRGAHGGRVEQVDPEPARAREVDYLVACVRARAREVNTGEAGRTGDQDAATHPVSRAAGRAALRPARR
jgi:hypothetical protein